MNAGLCRSCLSITSVHSNESHARRLFHPQEFAAVRISSIESIRTEGTIEAGPDSKSVPLDILCSSENGNYYDIEMQAQDTGELPKRSRYYRSMMDEMQLQRSGMYKELANSYVIFLCSFDPFKKGKYAYIFRSTCVGCPDPELGDGQSRIFLNAASHMDDVPPQLRAFFGRLPAIPR